MRILLGDEGHGHDRKLGFSNASRGTNIGKYVFKHVTWPKHIQVAGSEGA